MTFLLLASASPARRRLLEQAAIPHRVQPSDIDEAAIVEQDPALLVQCLARAKAEAVATGGSAVGSWGVLGCDSLLQFEGEVFGKPDDPGQAVARWRRLAGRWGDLLTGHCLLELDADGSVLGLRQQTVVSRVFFAPITEAEITAYVATGEPLQCAGGFALEGRGGLMVERIEGCFSNVIGLSLPLLRRWLPAAQP